MSIFPIPYVFVWSDNYKVFADCLKKSIEMYPSIITDLSEYIPQSEFDKTIYKNNNHFLSGCFIKLEKTLECLYSLPENSYFIFSDADIMLFPNRKLESLLTFYCSIESDIVFMRESLTNEISNIGFSLIRVNEHNRKLFKKVMDMSTDNPNELDQTLVNQALKEYTGSHYYFPCELVGTSSTIIGLKNNRSHTNYTTQIIPNYIIIQPLCNPTESRESVLQQKINEYKHFNLI